MVHPAQRIRPYANASTEHAVGLSREEGRFDPFGIPAAEPIGRGRCSGAWGRSAAAEGTTGRARARWGLSGWVGGSAGREQC